MIKEKEIIETCVDFLYNNVQRGGGLKSNYRRGTSEMVVKCFREINKSIFVYGFVYLKGDNITIFGEENFLNYVGGRRFKNL